MNFELFEQCKQLFSVTTKWKQYLVYLKRNMRRYLKFEFFLFKFRLPASRVFNWMWTLALLITLNGLVWYVNFELFKNATSYFFFLCYSKWADTYFDLTRRMRWYCPVWNLNFLLFCLKFSYFCFEFWIEGWYELWTCKNVEQFEYLSWLDKTNEPYSNDIDICILVWIVVLWPFINANRYNMKMKQL